MCVTRGEVGRDVHFKFVEFVTYLLDGLVEEAAGELGLDLLFEPPVRGQVLDINSVSGA